jgi:hypothetical protein
MLSVYFPEMITSIKDINNNKGLLVCNNYTKCGGKVLSTIEFCDN